MKIVVAKMNNRLKYLAISLSAVSIVLISVIIINTVMSSTPSLYATKGEKEYIKWVNFGITATVLNQALQYDIDSQSTNHKISWIDLLSYAACKNGGSFKDEKNKHIDDLAKKLQNGENINELTKSLKNFSYYKEAYSAVLSGMVGAVTEEIYSETEKNNKTTRSRYGLTAFSPIAKGYGYSHSDDFGNARSYGFKREHLGNDLIGSVGTPIIAVEDGIIENMGWNKYGGWRIGIRSLDFKRYYYYAHLKKGHPYVEGLKEGMEVHAGDVIGYLGMTGYSDTEDFNGMTIPHLHFGMQLIFDESQINSNYEIWIDVYQIVKFLQNHKMSVIKNEKTGEYTRRYQIKKSL